MGKILERLAVLSKEELILLITKVYNLQEEQSCELIELHLLKNDPNELASSLRNKINKWIRRTGFISYRESSSYAAQICVVREEIETSLLPLDPEAAWRLIDKVVRNDGKIMETMDDSDGAVGYELNEFSILWLKAAKMMNLPDNHWIPLIIEIAEGDDYGCRNNFLENTNMLLSDETLLDLYNRCKQRFLETRNTKTDGFDFVLLTLRVDMGQIAIALKDPDLYKESVTIASPEPNNLQMLDIINRYIELGRSEDAKIMLDKGSWTGRDRTDVERYYKQIFRSLGDTENLVETYRRDWEYDPSISNLEEYLKQIDSSKHEEIIKRAKMIAEGDSELNRGVGVLIYLKELEKAEEIFLSNQEYFNAKHYTTLLWLLDLLGTDGSFVSQIVLYRALLMDLLNRAYSKAYHHAAKYYKKLKVLDNKVIEYPSGLVKHDIFYSELLEKHGKKRSFWARVESKRSN